MKTSTEIGSIAKLVGERKAVELVGKAGFDAWDFSLGGMGDWDWERKVIKDIPHPLKESQYLEFARELKKIGEAYGMVCNQSHAPFPTNCMPLDYMKRSIECTAEVGGKICIIHPNNDGTAEENAEFYHKILPFAKDYGVKIATENMYNWEKGASTSCFAACATIESFLKHLELVDDPYLVACLDIGHAEMQGSGDGAVPMIKALGNHLQALHIHDNDKIRDSHQIPFSMSIDFEAIAKVLKEVNYEGYLTLEAAEYLPKYYTAETAFEGVKNLLESTKKLDQIVQTASV